MSDTLSGSTEPLLYEADTFACVYKLTIPHTGPNGPLRHIPRHCPAEDLILEGAQIHRRHQKKNCIQEVIFMGWQLVLILIRYTKSYTKSVLAVRLLNPNSSRLKANSKLFTPLYKYITYHCLKDSQNTLNEVSLHSSKEEYIIFIYYLYVNYIHLFHTLRFFVAI